MRTAALPALTHLCLVEPSADARALLNSLSLDWSSSAPAGLRSGDFWAARLSFVLLAPTTANYTLAVAVDDVVSVEIDGDMLLAPGGSRQVVVLLAQGYHDIEMHFMEAAGAANLQVMWDAGVPNAVSRHGILYAHLHASFTLQRLLGHRLH